jgi:hypothetical protein
MANVMNVPQALVVNPQRNSGANGPRLRSTSGTAFSYSVLIVDVNEADAKTAEILQEMQDLAQAMSWENSAYAGRVHDLLLKIRRHPGIRNVQEKMGFRVVACRAGTTEITRTIVACSNADVAAAAWTRACKTDPDYRWLLLWGAMVQRDSKPLKPAE